MVPAVRAPVGRAVVTSAQRPRRVSDDEVDRLVRLAQHGGSRAEHQLDVRRVGGQPDQQRPVRPGGRAFDQPGGFSGTRRAGAALSLEGVQRRAQPPLVLGLPVLDDPAAVRPVGQARLLGQPVQLGQGVAATFQGAQQVGFGAQRVHRVTAGSVASG